jgi:hypothetical protein
MTERREQPRLALKPRQPLGIGDKCGRHDLDRHVAPELRIVCAIYLTHPARAEQRYHLIRADPPTLYPEQRFDVPPQRLVRPARLGEKGRTVTLVSLQRGAV